MKKHTDVRATAALTIWLAVTGCHPTAEKPALPKPVKPAVDVSTPDKALKSYWAVKDWLEHSEISRRNADEFERQLITVREVTDGDAYATFYRGTRNAFVLEKFERDILDVKVDTESRATIMARVKNVTPPSADDAPFIRSSSSNEGDVFRYVLEKNEGKWRVVQAWRRWISSSDWSKVFDNTPRAHTFTQP